MPGKCIACRQKIRIPRRDELPPDTIEVYLRDHPEFLRQPQRAPLEGSDVTPTGDEQLDAFQDADEARVSTIPLDGLEILQVLCSLEHVLTRHIANPDPERDYYESQRHQVRAARRSVDDQLRQRLMEVAIELANTHEKLAQTGLSARLGEIEYMAYREIVERYRRTRDRLERRQQNLRAWLTVPDPHRAGGLVDVHVDHVPDPHAQVAIPTEEEPTQPLLHVYVEGLREALFERAESERRVREAERMLRDAVESRENAEDLRADCHAGRQRAEARVTFCRGRLQQVIHDLKADAQVIQAQLELARGRVQVGELARDRFDTIERQLRQAADDVATGVAVAQRAINANAAQDVPYPRGTFLGRLGLKTRDHGLAMDSYLLWLAAALLVGSVFFPAWGERSFMAAVWDARLAGTLWQWSVLGPLAAAGALVILSAVEMRRMRGAVTLALWLVATCLGAYFLHELRYSLSPAADAMRDVNMHWYTAPAFLLILAAHALTLVATCVALAPYRERWAAPAVAGIAAIVTFFVFTDLLGWRTPDPYVRVELPAATIATAQPVTVIVGNRGGRELFLTASATNIVNGYLFAVEEQIGPTSWREVAVPTTRRTDVPVAHPVVNRVPAGGVERLTVMLGPGTYRAKLRNHVHEDIDVQVFRLHAPPTPRHAPAAAESTATRRDAAIPTRVEAEFKLMIGGPNRAPRFAISLFPPGGTEIKRDVSLQDEVHEGWYLAEFNRNSQTITLSDGTQMVIIERGQRLLLPIAQPPQDPS